MRESKLKLKEHKDKTSGKNKYCRQTEQTISYLYHFLIGLTILFCKILNICPVFPLVFLIQTCWHLLLHWKVFGSRIIWLSAVAAALTAITKMNEHLNCPLNNMKPCLQPWLCSPPYMAHSLGLLITPDRVLVCSEICENCSYPTLNLI